MFLLFFYLILLYTSPGASWSSTATNENEDSDDEAVGGLFKMKNRAKSTGDHVMHERDCSKVTVKDTREWQDILADIKDCFVSGKWKETEDAEALLQLDDQDDGRFLVAIVGNRSVVVKKNYSFR